MYFYKLGSAFLFSRERKIIMKKPIQIIASTDTYSNLSTFTDLQEFNEAIRTHKEAYKGELTKSAISVLNLIQRYSTKHLGVSFLTKNRIASLLEISRRTVIRACQLLESLGIIKQYEMKRKTDMLQTSNAIVIQPVQIEVEEEIVTQEESKMSHHKNNISLKQIHNINHLNNKRSPYIKYVPKNLQHYQAYFGQLTKELYGRIWFAAKKRNVHVDSNLMQEIALKAFGKLKEYVKEGRSLSDEQLCKIAYVISKNQLQDRVDQGDILDWNYEAARFFKLTK